MKRIRLEVVGGDVDSNEIALTLPATIGRGREASISLTHPLVSRKHCEIVFSQGRVLVRDLDSLNGTFVGSERVAESILRSGDLLTIGTVTFRALYDDAHPPGKESMPHNGAHHKKASRAMNGTSSVARSSRDTFQATRPAEVDPTQTNDSNGRPSPAESDA